MDCFKVGSPVKIADDESYSFFHNLSFFVGKYYCNSCTLQCYVHTYTLRIGTNRITIEENKRGKQCSATIDETCRFAFQWSSNDSLLSAAYMFCLLYKCGFSGGNNEGKL